MSTATQERMSPRQRAKLDEMLLTAASSGTVVTVREALEQGANLDAVDATGDGALLHAARDNPDPAVARFLIEQGGDLMKAAVGGPTPLHFFALRGHLDLVKMALARGVPVDGPPMRRRNDLYSSPLCYAAKGDQIEIMAALLTAGAQPNHWNPSGQLAIHLATSPAAVDLLCSRGAKLNPTADFFPPLFVAARRPGGAAVCEAMIRHGADVNLRGTAGETALHIAHPENCETLVKHGGNLEQPDFFGLTPLAFSACFDDVEKCEELLRLGASLSPSDHVAPLSAAADDDALESFAVLIKAGADPTGIEPTKLERIWGLQPGLRKLAEANASRAETLRSARTARDEVAAAKPKVRPR